MPSKLQKAIGAVKDQTSISLAKVSNNTYSNLEVAVLKATTHDDDVPVDLKSVNIVLRLVSSNKFHAAACARAIGKRIGRTRNWVVALKSLMLVLRIFQDGDPYFPREVLHAMRRGAKILNLSGFRDDSCSGPWDFTAFVRTFALYLDERLECFLTGKLQRRSYVHETTRGSWVHQRAKGPREPVRGMKPAMLLDKISCWQRLLERAIATRPTGEARTNRLVHAALYAIVQESFDLYKDVSDGLTLILDSFFHLQFQNCVSAFQACAKAARQFRELSGFYSLCKSIGVGRSSEYPSVQTISEELVDALQEFLKDQDSFTSKLANRPDPSNDRLPSGKTTPETGLQCTTSLEDLINASETGTCPAISIDLEAYSGPRIDGAFTNMSETGSTRSLPVSNSMADLMSLWDWSELEEREKQQQQEQIKQNGLVNPISSDHSNNWELVLAETISPPDNAATFQAANHQPATTGWEVVLFEAATPQYMQQPIMPTSNNQYYNPFLQDAFEVMDFQPAMSAAPTFQAIPSFSMHNQTPFAAQMNNDPFGPVPSFSSEPVFSGSVDHQQNLLFEQQLWLRNQNKIIAKHMT
ncbi:clathrin coat assembly protein ap180 [Phtheirospermum japonicum]|uniref:Clathrin coat assembly protein ap180 n=1 Tax=Phtheirospermum japonicum TaxID=374723 RepID=A0A830D4M8_9LAMI|nr:clathrin coat assembly protein ap180 [Phtheirospermum japonicum]